MQVMHQWKNAIISPRKKKKSHWFIFNFNMKKWFLAYNHTVFWVSALKAWHQYDTFLICRVSQHLIWPYASSHTATQTITILLLKYRMKNAVNEDDYRFVSVSRLHQIFHSAFVTEHPNSHGNSVKWWLRFKPSACWDTKRRGNGLRTHTHTKITQILIRFSMCDLLSDAPRTDTALKNTQYSS